MGADTIGVLKAVLANQIQQVVLAQRQVVGVRADTTGVLKAVLASRIQQVTQPLQALHVSPQAVVAVAVNTGIL